MESKPGHVKIITTEHKSILAQFLKSDVRQLSAGELHSFTNIEPVKISAILADLMAHGMVHHTDPGESGGAWLYHLTDYGRTFASGNT
jgi:hypothetical protein